MKKSLCFVLLFILLMSSVGYAQEIPNLKKYVNDYANILTDSQEYDINALCGQIEDNSTVEVVVLTVNTTMPMSIEEYAVKVFEANGIEKKDRCK